jgi:hypothetical protein
MADNTPPSNNLLKLFGISLAIVTVANIPMIIHDWHKFKEQSVKSTARVPTPTHAPKADTLKFVK